MLFSCSVSYRVTASGPLFRQFLRELAACWVEIQQRNPLQVTVSIRGHAKTVPDISFDELISIIDQAEALARTV